MPRQKRHGKVRSAALCARGGAARTCSLSSSMVRSAWLSSSCRRSRCCLTTSSSWFFFSMSFWSFTCSCFSEEERSRILWENGKREGERPCVKSQAQIGRQESETGNERPLPHQGIL